MEINQALIEKFLLGRCQPAEAAAIVLYLKDHVEVLEKFAGKAEWDDIPHAFTVEATLSRRLLQKLQQELFAVKKPVHKMVAVRYAARLFAAAAIITVAAGALWMMDKPARRPASVTIARADTAKFPQNAILQQTWQTKVNTGQKPVRVKLQDGSAVTLYPNTIIKYLHPFMGSTREIILSGDAFFEVAKNRLKPFIVTSGNLSTTALGTSFRVTAFRQGVEKISVQLFTGKVVIKPTRQIANWKADIFLSPGEEMTFNQHSLASVVSKFSIKKVLFQHAMTDVPQQVAGRELRFSNTPLQAVFEQLTSLYSIKINYSRADIRLMNFTGLISRSDDIQKILIIITEMNGLRLLRTGEAFTVSKGIPD